MENNNFFTNEYGSENGSYSFTQSDDNPVDELIDELIDEPIDEAVDESIDEPVNESVNKSINNSFAYANQRKRRYKKKKHKYPNLTKVIVAALVCGLCMGSSYGLIMSVKEIISSKYEKRIETTVNENDKALKPEVKDISDIVSKVMPSVVSITGTYQINNIFGLQSQAKGAGSGFIIADNKDKLYIATNNHVVADSSSLTVGFVDKTSVSAKIVGKDSNADLAVIEVNKKDIKEDTLNHIKTATLGSSDTLKVGQQVIAIGNALGYGQSVTTGILSAKDREISFSDGTLSLLQTDAAINPGNSGGILVNLKGEVIGINNAKLADTAIEGVGYAIPISTANPILNDLMNATTVSKNDTGFLGVVGKNIDENYSAALGIPKGVYVSQIIKDSPAQEADIHVGDVIIEIDGNQISTMQGLKERISIKKAGSVVTVTIQRPNQSGEYQKKKLKVTLGKSGDFIKEKQNETEEKQNETIENDNKTIPYNEDSFDDDFNDFFFEFSH